jgi:FlaA1/EpsC-like NDP-sugar epimerase
MLPSQVFKLRNRHFLVLDIIIFAVTPLLALSLRLDTSLGFILSLQKYQESLFIATALFTGIKLIIALSFGLYKHYWRYAGVDELVKIATLMGVAVIFQVLLFNVLQSISILDLPRSLPIIDGLLTLLLVGASRFGVRVIARSQQRGASKQCDRVLIIGAGNAGVSLVQQLRQDSALNLIPVAFIDDDPRKT